MLIFSRPYYSYNGRAYAIHYTVLCLSHLSVCNVCIVVRADNGSQFLTHDHVTHHSRMTCDPWPSPRPWYE